MNSKIASPLWRCPACRRKFANKNQSHFCGRHDLESHFENKPEAVLRFYNLFVTHLRKCGPVTVLPEKTRIAFQVRMSFAAVRLQREKMVGHLVLAHRHERPCFIRIDSISRHNHIHHFQIKKPDDLNAELCRFIKKAYEVGQQNHLKLRGI